MNWLQGVAKSLNHDCIARPEPSKVHFIFSNVLVDFIFSISSSVNYCWLLILVQCFFPQEFIGKVKTPVFLVQPAYDFWQVLFHAIYSTLITYTNEDIYNITFLWTLSDSKYSGTWFIRSHRQLASMQAKYFELWYQSTTCTPWYNFGMTWLTAPLHLFKIISFSMIRTTGSYKGEE